MFLVSYFKPKSHRRFLSVCLASLILSVISVGMVSNADFFVRTGFAVAATSNATSAPLVPPAGPVYFDFDGDGKTDIGRWHPATTEFKVKNSNGGSFSTYTIGSSAAKSAPGRYYSSDVLTDVAVFNAGTWTIRNSANGNTETISFGQSGDIPMSADYDGDGITDLSIIRPSTNTWWVKQSTNGSIVPYSAGGTGDIAVPGDYDDDNKTDIALYRPSTGVWTITYSSNNSTGTYTWGSGTDIPVPADYDGDGKTDVAVYRRTNGTWYVIGSTAGWITQAWGNYGDQPTPGYYDGDNKADFSIWRPTTGTWHTILSTGPTFDTQALGVPGDTAVPSSYLKQIGGTVSAYALAQSRLSPKNATGGTDLYSRNFAWGTSLVSLSGRAGLNAGFGIGYNSLVWTKTGNEIHFDSDVSNVSAGFRMGFPTIEQAYLDDKTGNFAYLMVTPSGSRVEFRQIGATNVYETADSSYAQLTAPINSNPNDPVENLTLYVTGTDGTQMKYVWKGGAFRCSEIKDRNGNYITIIHNDFGQLTQMTDTLGRVVTVGYDAYGQPSTVKQMWGSGTNGSGSLTSEHTWATLTYTNTTVTTDIDGSLTVVGPPNTTSLRVLEKITYADQSATKFYYNSYAQVYKVENLAPNSDSLNYVRMDSLQYPNANQFDCPKFTDRRTWAKDFNNSAEVVTHNTLTASQSYSPPVGSTETLTKIDVSTYGHPNNYLSRTFVAQSGWREGMPIATEDWTEGTGGWTKQRWTWANYTQDNTSVSYPVNPRVVESRVGDATNTKKTAIEYYMVGSSSVADYGLVKKVEVGDGSTIYKKVITKYNLASAYTDKRIIGLPSETNAWGKDDVTNNLEFIGKTQYSYDQGSFSESGQNITGASKHDDDLYGSSFVTGRGNLTSTIKCDAANSDIDTCNGGITSSVKYNTLGNVVSQTDPAGRVVRIGYTDNFSNNPTPQTYAYPTSVTDPGGSSLGATGHTSTVTYRYDIGANVSATSPPPGTQTVGKTTKRIYDSAGRLERDSVYVGTTEQAYTRYSRPSPDTGLQLFTHSTLVDNNNVTGLDAGDEVTSETILDGAGRVLRSRKPHTFDSNGVATWAATKTEYDIIGRPKKQSVPTEVNSSWAPTGDDSTFLWTYQKYDWMDRVIRKIGTDGIDQETYNDSDVLISYATCGCAGGQVTTVQAENVLVPDLGGTKARRTTKVYADPMGRDFKTEVFGWNGTSLYSRTTALFNGRDQVLEVQQTDHSVTTPVTQTTSMTYDGYGRLKTQHRPEQNANTNTTYNYNTDDSISSVVDAGGATVNYSYGTLKLPVFVQYSVPQNSNIQDPSNIVYTYDALGNRITMEDGLGEVQYNYNSLSQLTSESRMFDDIADPPTPDDKFTIGYSYHIGGQLKSYTDPMGREIKYTHDKVGKLSAVHGTLSSVTTEYADNPHYRAWGALTHLDYGNGTEMNVGGFNSRLQATTFNVKKGTTDIINKTYAFHNDGQVKLETDNLNSKFNRSYMFDHVGRIQQARSGAEATGGTSTPANIPYTNDFEYNAFGNQTKNEYTHFSRTGTVNESYTNNRVAGGTFDAEGNQTVDATFSSKYYFYDAANNLSKTTYEYAQSNEPYIFNQEFLTYDGDGYLVKTATSHQEDEDPPETDANYTIRSSLLKGEVISTANSLGSLSSTYVRANGTVVAVEGLASNPIWMHKDPNLKSLRSTDNNGNVISSGTGDQSPKELDVTGNETEFADPYTQGIPDPNPGFIEPFESFGSLQNGQFTTQTVDGAQVPRNHFNRTNDFMFQGFFGVIERQARLSQGTYVGSVFTFTDANGNTTQITPEQADWLKKEAPGRVTENRIFAVDITDNSWALNWALLKFQLPQQQLAPLSGDESKKIASQVKVLKEKLNKVGKDCQKMVIDKLNTVKGFSLDKFLQYLEKGVNVYDGTKSEILLTAALDPKQFNRTPPATFVDTVADYFSDNPGASALTSGTLSAKVYTVFWRPDAPSGFSKARLFHEGLHAFGAFLNGGSLGDFGDKEIQALFGLTVDPKNSSNITDYIDDHCF